MEIQRVETLNNAAVGVTWATVCVHTWTKKIGEVACRQLGYEDFGTFPSVSQFTTLGHRRVALKVKSCKGTEQSLESCETVPFHSQLNCSHQHDLAVLCASECLSVSIFHKGTVHLHLAHLPPAFVSKWGILRQPLYYRQIVLLHVHAASRCMLGILVV